MIRYILLSLLLVIGNTLLAQFEEHLLLSNDNVALHPKDFVLRDLDGDGDLDVLSCSNIGQTVSWHENLGAGIFGPVQMINSSANIGLQVEASDVDGDGDLDALVSDNLWVSWYENTGGQFSTTENLITSTKGVFVLFDFDNDGDEDLFIQPSGFVSGLQLAENNGNGTFASPITISTAPQKIGNINKGDVDGDGDIDIVSVSRDQGGTNRNVCWIENLNPGWTTHIISTSSTIEEGEIVLSDADSDGDKDIICARGDNSNLTVYYNNGTSFSAGTSLNNTISSFNELKNADLNGDGFDDLVLGNSQNSSIINALYVYMNSSSGYTVTNLSFENYTTTDMKLGDIDGDGDIDIVCSNQFDEIVWLENDGLGNFIEEHYIAISAFSVSDIACVDIGNNGLKDIVVTTTNSNRLLYLQNDFGNFDYRKKLSARGGQQILSADFNSDGLEDMMSFHAANPEINWFPQLTGSTFGTANTIFQGGSFPEHSMSDTFDCNNDGLTDICFTRNKRISWAINNGGSWSTPNSIGGNYLNSIFPVDMDNDGLTDLVSSSDLFNRIYWSQNQGSGNFASPQILLYTSGSNKNPIVYDFDGDSINDVLTTSSSNIAYYRGLAGLTYDPPIILTAGSGLSTLSDLEAADMDGDGDLDIIASFSGSGHLIWIENLGNNSFGTLQVISTNYAGSNEILIEDMDLDGDKDIVISSETGGKIAWFENKYHSPNQARGKLFIDLNQNGIEDSTDVPMPFTEVISTPNYTFAHSYEDGRYFMNFADTAYNSYNIEPEFLQDWGITTSSPSYTVIVDSAFVFMDSLDFGMYPTNIKDSIIVEFTGGFPRCNTVANYWLDVKNVGTTFPSGVIQLTLDDSISYVGSSIAPDSIINQDIYWSYDSLFFFDIAQINLFVQMPTFVNMGNNLQSILQVTVDSLSGSVYTASKTLNQILVCAYDPNDKIADPKGIEPDGMGYIPPSTEHLDYTIRFQNTGTASATDVIITDQLDPSLDWSSIEILSYSDAYQLDFHPSGLVEFKFENINLPDSAADFLGSQGFIKFRINLEAGLPIPTIIQNEANIYFDQNPPILTNTETNTLFECQNLLNGIAFTQTACKNSPVQINIPGEPTSTNYNWQINNVISQTGDTFSWFADTAGIFDLYLSISNPLCFIDTTVQLNIIPTSAPTVLPMAEVCNGDSLLIFNKFESVSGVYYDTLNSFLGCDSIVSIHLNTLPTSTGINTISECDSYTWIDGNTYNTSNNTATHILTNSLGCDSLVTLNLIINQSTSGTDFQTACNSFTWIDGNTYNTSNNTATHILTNSSGCDSLVTLNLIINQSTSGTDFQTACNSYTWIDGNTYSTSNNTATHILTNSSGCDSLVQLDLTINNVSEVTTSLNGATITANNINATYQWLDCDNNNMVINGETNQSITVTNNGNYAVEITENGCVDTSECVTVNSVDVVENSLESKIAVYPNPSDGKFKVDLGKIYSNLEVTLTDSKGKIIQNKEYNNTQLFELDIEEPSGVYILMIKSGVEEAIISLVKK